MADIRIDDVARTFGSYQALDRIDLVVPDGAFTVLLGASGCGKTTLLRIVAGLEQPSRGEVRIGGRRVDHLPPRARGIAMVFQNYAVFPHLVVFENIAFGLRMQRLPQPEIDRRVARVAELMHIGALLRRYSGELSGGQRQRVAVARALAMQPDVILMDEPLSNLDALLRLEMRAELKGILAESRTTTLYVTHDQTEAMSLADSIAVMSAGRIVQCASPVEVYRNPATRFVGGFIGNPPMNFLPAGSAGPGRWQLGGLLLDGPAASGPTLLAGIRPEDVVLADGGLAATVRVVEPMGSHMLATCDAAGTLLRVVLESDHRARPGDVLAVAPRADRLRWFDPDGAAVGTRPTVPHHDRTAA